MKSAYRNLLNYSACYLCRFHLLLCRLFQIRRFFPYLDTQTFSRWTYHQMHTLSLPPSFSLSFSLKHTHTHNRTPPSKTSILFCLIIIYRLQSGSSRQFVGFKFDFKAFFPIRCLSARVDTVFCSCLPIENHELLLAPFSVYSLLAYITSVRARVFFPHTANTAYSLVFYLISSTYVPY